MTQAEQQTDRVTQTQHSKDVQRMSIAYPNLPTAVWDIEASEEMATQWDEFINHV